MHDVISSAPKSDKNEKGTPPKGTEEIRPIYLLTTFISGQYGEKHVNQINKTNNQAQYLCSLHFPLVNSQQNEAVLGAYNTRCFYPFISINICLILVINVSADGPDK